MPITVPRQPRLDAPATLHHVMARGIERRALFRDERDRTDFLARLPTCAAPGALTEDTLALLANHAHLLLRTGTRPLPCRMRSLRTSDAGALTREHHQKMHM